MEDKSTIEYWRPSGLLEGIREENRAALCELFESADEYVSTHLIVAVRQMFLQMTEGEQMFRDPGYSLSNANNKINDAMDKIASDIQDLMHHTCLLRKMFGHTDIEAEMLTLYANDKAREFTSPLR